jgi:peptidoglycan DL-endopeptidase CwlO
VTAGTHRARHRAARRPIAPLAAAQTVATGTAARRAAIVATAGGLIVSTFGASSAQAAPAPQEAANKLSTVDLGALTEQAREALEAAPVLTVAADAKLSVEQAPVSVTPAPEPEPVVERETTTASRTAERTETAAEAPAEAPAAEVPASANGSLIVSIATRYIGVPYVSGGTTPDGFDCSGFTQYVFAQAGISIPRTTADQRYAGTVVSAADRQPGDLIWTSGHVAIYVGDGMQIDAPRPGKTIQIRSIWQSSPTYIRVA